MTPDRPTLNFLNAFPEENRAEGERLQKAGYVTQIFGDRLVIQGRVEEPGGDICRTVLRFKEGEWTGECSCSQNERCPAVCATMMERIARNGHVPEAPNEIEDASLTEILEKRLERELSKFEDDYVDKLEKRYRRYETEGELRDHDIVRLNPRWPVESYDPIELWPVPPANILEFWNYVAYHFRNRNLAYPKFMDAITDFESVEEKLQEWEREQAEESWRKSVYSFSEPDRTPPIEIEVRLLITTSEAKLQWRRNDDGESFQTVQQTEELAHLRTRYAQGALRMDVGSSLVWDNFEDALAEEQVTLRLDDVEQGKVLNRLFHTENARDRLINLDERNLRVETRPFRWLCQENAGEDPEMMSLQLLSADDEPIPHSVRLLPGREPFYLGDEAVYPGPAFWEEGTEVQPRYEIPRKVLWSEAGVAFLHGIGAGLPESLQRAVKEVPMRVRMDLRLNQKHTGADSEQLLVEITAIDPEETREEIFEKDGWIVAGRKEYDPSQIYRYQREGLRRFPELLDPMNLTYDPPRQCFRTRVTKTFPERFVSWLDELPEDIEITTDEHLDTLLQDPVKASVTFDIVASDIDWFDLKIAVDVEGLDLSIKEIRALVAARGGFVRMENGGWLRLEIDLTEQQAEAVNRLGLDPFDMSGETHRMHVLQLSDPMAREVFDDKAWDKICERSKALKLQVAPAVPSDLKMELRPYQVEGFQFLSYLSTNGFGGILADDMGLGKTVQSITWLLWMWEQAGKDHSPVLVVCPKTVLDVWAGEVKKFAPHLRIQILRHKSELDMEKVKKDVDVLVMNYSQLRVNIEKLIEQRWLAVILDEGQQIKNPDSKAAKAARKVKADNRLVLTGTPIENRLLDIWSLMAFAMPGVLGTRKYFKERFDRRRDPHCQERLSARLRPFLLRRTKNQVAVDLPPRTEEDVFCKLEGPQQEAYEMEIERIRREVLAGKTEEALNRNRFTILQGLTRLRQICCHPGLFDSAYRDEESAKMNALFYLLNQLRDEGHKVLVFSQFVTMLELIRERLEEEDRPYVMLTGQTQDRQAVIEKFQTSKDPTVFLLSLKAGGSGLNLTAASYVVLYDPWWNPAVENQAIDRTHRIGQTNKVIAYRLLMQDSVEEKIRVLQQQKEAMSSGVLGEEGFAKTLTSTDLEFLFATGSE